MYAYNVIYLVMVVQVHHSSVIAAQLDMSDQEIGVLKVVPKVSTSILEVILVIFVEKVVRCVPVLLNAHNVLILP